MSTVTVDCSIGGVAVVTREPVEPATVLQATLSVDDDPLVARTEVCHCLSQGQRWIVGLHFLALSPGDEERMARFVAASDRRVSRRVKVALSVEYNRVGEPVLRTSSTDISAGAIRFLAASELSIGDRLEMVVILAEKRFAIDGTVVGLDHTRMGLMACVCFDPRTRFQEDDLADTIRCLATRYPLVES